MPKPYSCYSVIWPIDFAIVSYKTSNTSAYIVKGFALEAQVNTDFQPLLKSINVGDEWVGLDNMTISQLESTYKLSSGGTNVFSVKRAIVAYFTIRTGYLFTLPTQTTATYTLKRPNGSLYTLTFPLRNTLIYSQILIHFIVVRYSKNCISITHSRIHEQKQPIQLDMFSNTPASHYNADYAHFFSTPLLTDTSNPSISFTHFTLNKNQIGVVRLDTFNPFTGIRLFLDTLKEVLMNEMRNVDALIFDVRDNGGGLSGVVDGVIRFISSHYKVAKMRALMTDLNRNILKDTIFNGTG